MALVSCDDRTEAALPPPGPDGFPRLVELPGGGDLRLDTRPVRVVAATTSAVDYVASLVGPERIAAVCKQAFESSVLTLDPDPWKSKPSFENFRVETTLEAAPDLIVCSAFSNPDTIAILRRTRIPLVQLGEPLSYDEVFANLQAVGQMLGTEEKARTLATQLRHTLANVQSDAPGEGRTALYLSRNGADSWTAGRETLAHSMILSLGFENAAARLGTGPRSLALEKLLELDPDVLIVSETNVREFDDERLRGLRALRTIDGKRPGLIALPDALYQTTSHRSIEALRWIAEALR